MTALVWMRPLGLGGRHALDPMDAGLPAQALVHALAIDREDDLLVAAQLGGGAVQGLDLPFAALGVARIHAEEIGHEEGGLVASRPRPYLHDDALVGEGIAGDEELLEANIEEIAFLLEAAKLLPGELPHLDIGFVLDEEASVLDARESGLVLGIDLFDRREAGPLPHDLAIARRILGETGIGDDYLELAETGREGLEFIDHGRIFSSKLGQE